MARNYNQDYFKVGGTHADDRDQTRASRAKLAYQAAIVSHARKQEPFPTRKPKAASKRREASASETKAASVSVLETRAAERAVPQSDQPKQRQTLAEVQDIRPEKPKHGKKRRSTKKRHDVDVIQELRANPSMSPRAAGEMVRSGDRSPAAEQMGRGDERAAGVPSSAMPNAAPRKELRGLFGLARSGFRTGQRVFRYAKDVVIAPLVLARALRELRERNATR